LEEVSKLNSEDKDSLNIDQFKADPNLKSNPDIIPIESVVQREGKIQVEERDYEEVEEEEDSEEDQGEEEDVNSDKEERVDRRLSGARRKATKPTKGHADKRRSSANISIDSSDDDDDNTHLSPSIPSSTGRIYYNTDEPNGYVDPFKHDSDEEFPTELERMVKLNAYQGRLWLAG
jgi:hypothetical protein